MADQTNELPSLPQRELDALLDHIYEYGTTAEGIRERALKLCEAYARAALAAQPTTSAETAATVNRETVIEWLDALDIEVTDKQLDGLFHATPVAAQAPSVPEGWVMVPAQPTEVMKAAGCRALGSLYGHYGAEQCWKAMLRAAPAQEDRND